MDSHTPTILNENFYKILLDSIFDAVYTVDVDGRIVYWNESCERITGYTAEEMIGQSYRESSFRYDPDGENSDKTTMGGGIDIVLKNAMPGTWKGYICRKNGQRIPVESHIAAIRNHNNEVIGVGEVFRDISAHVALEQAHRQVLQIARKDQLTGLYNRTAITELFKAEIERTRRYGQPLSVVMADIDHFKRINDRYGHDAGDKVLAKIGSILAFNTRKPDAAGRWGGEEFLLVVPGSNAQAASQLADRIRNYIQDVPTSELPEQITVSFGVAEFGEKVTQDQLLFIADKALYKAKDTGRNKVVIGSQETE